MTCNELSKDTPLPLLLFVELHYLKPGSKLPLPERVDIFLIPKPSGKRMEHLVPGCTSLWVTLIQQLGTSLDHTLPIFQVACRFVDVDAPKHGYRSLGEGCDSFGASSQ